MTDGPSIPNQSGILTDADHDKAVTALLAAAGPGGLPQDEFERQFAVVISWLAEQKLGAQAYQVITEEQLALRVDEHGEVHLILRRETEQD